MTCPSCSHRTPADLGPCPGCGSIGVPFLDGYFNAPPPVELLDVLLARAEQLEGEAAPGELDPVLRAAIELGVMSEGQVRDCDAFADGLVARVRSGELTQEQGDEITIHDRDPRCAGRQTSARASSRQPGSAPRRGREKTAAPMSDDPRDPLERQIDAVLDALLQLTEEQRWAFVEQFGGAARRAGISGEQAAATFRDLARMVAKREG
jgi:hypothetical protein